MVLRFRHSPKTMLRHFPGRRIIERAVRKKKTSRRISDNVFDLCSATGIAYGDFHCRCYREGPFQLHELRAILNL